MKKIFCAAALAVVASLALAGTASADVPRYQPTATLTVSLSDYPGYVHTFTIAWADPCSPAGVFTGTGQGSTLAGGATETITGALVGDSLTFTAVYTSFIPGYTWHQSDFTITWDVAAITTYKNHGEYVNWAKSHGVAASVAAKSCLGMPIPYSWSTSGTIAPTLTGASILLPVAGTYRIDVTGTWVNGGYGWVDAEYTDNQAGAYQDGWPGLGADFGDLMVGGAFVNWGAYDAGHAYSYTGPFSSGSLNLGLAVFDGQGGVPVTGWYADNSGSLAYTVTFVGP